MRILIIFFLFFLISCDNNNDSEISKYRKNKIEVKDKLKKVDLIDISSPKNDSVITKKEVKTKKLVEKKEHQIRFEDGISDAKLNGELILLQTELSLEELNRNSDVIQNLVKSSYLSMEFQFPRSIADDFENGISTERISYPKLNFTVEIFKDSYAKKPYQIKNYSVRKEKNGSLIVE